MPTLPHASQRTRLTRIATVLLVALALPGCSNPPSRPDAVTVYPVEGRLFVGGKPAAGAVVSLHPGGGGTPVTAKVRDDGRFVPTQSDGAVGLPEGAYSLTATWTDGGKPRLAEKYADPAKPIARLTVRPGVNLMPPIKLP